MDDLIEKLSNLRSQFNCFNENERDAYHILSEAIKALSEQPEPCEDAVSRADVVDMLEMYPFTEYSEYEAAREVVKRLPSAQPKQVCVANVTLTDEQVKELVEKAKNAVISVIKPEQRWISVSERLPEDDTEVFVYLFDRPSPYIAWVCDGCWFTEEFQVEKENYPKAWCELPEPYKERREG